MDQGAIEKEKDRLGSENADLRTILKQYLDGISVNEDVINNPGNPLMILNNKLRLNRPVRRRAAAAVRARALRGLLEEAQ